MAVESPSTTPQINLDRIVGIILNLPFDRKMDILDFVQDHSIEEIAAKFNKFCLTRGQIEDLKARLIRELRPIEKGIPVTKPPAPPPKTELELADRLVLLEYIFGQANSFVRRVLSMTRSNLVTGVTDKTAALSFEQTRALLLVWALLDRPQTINYRELTAAAGKDNIQYAYSILNQLSKIGLLKLERGFYSRGEKTSFYVSNLPLKAEEIFGVKILADTVYELVSLELPKNMKLVKPIAPVNLPPPEKPADPILRVPAGPPVSAPPPTYTPPPPPVDEPAPERIISPTEVPEQPERLVETEDLTVVHAEVVEEPQVVETTVVDQPVTTLAVIENPAVTKAEAFIQQLTSEVIELTGEITEKEAEIGDIEMMRDIIGDEATDAEISARRAQIDSNRATIRQHNGRLALIRRGISALKR